MSDVTKLSDLIDVRLSRRAALFGVAGGAALAAATGLSGEANAAGEPANDSPSTLTFREIEHGIDKDHHVAKGYTGQIVMRWGDPVETDAPPFDITQAIAESTGQTVRLQQRLHCLHAAAAWLKLKRSRSAVREP